MTIYICDGYWKANPELAMHETEPFYALAVSDGEWDGVEGEADNRIFFYTEGFPVVGDHGEFVITSATKGWE